MLIKMWRIFSSSSLVVTKSLNSKEKKLYPIEDTVYRSTDKSYLTINE